jgi:hypothetical protein
MLMQFRRLSVALAVAGSTLALPLVATPAAAVTPVSEVQLLIKYAGSATSPGIYSRVGDGTPSLLVAPIADTNLDALTTSADGSRFAYVQEKAAITKIVVRDISGRLVRPVDVSYAPYDFQSVDQPALSPDGNTLVWTRFDHSGSGPTTTLTTSLRRLDLGSGVQTELSNSLVGAVFLTPTTLVAVRAGTGIHLQTIPLAGGAVQDVVGSPGDGPFDVAVSHAAPSGDTGSLRLAWNRFVTGQPSAELVVAIGTLTHGALTISEPVPMGPAGRRAPAFSADDSALSFIQSDEGGWGDVFSVPSAGGTVTQTTSTPTDDEQEIATAGLGDAIAPGAAAIQPFTLAGTSATIRWTNPTDADLSGVIVERYFGIDTGPMQKSVFVAAPASAVTDTGLTLGTSYTYRVTTVDRRGLLAESSPTRSLTSAGVSVSFTDPTSTGSAGGPFYVTFGPAAGPTIRYSATYRPTTTGSYSPWMTNAAGSARVFGRPASSGVAATTVTPGSTYQFRASAVDSFGNKTGTTTSGSAVVPWDQTKATLFGGRNLSQAEDYFGTVRVLNAAGHYAKIAITGNRFQIIGQRCATCGVFDVFEGSTRIATVDSRAASTQFRVVLFTRTYPTVVARTVTIKARGTAGRPNVVLDGFAVRR